MLRYVPEEQRAHYKVVIKIEILVAPKIINAFLPPNIPLDFPR
jgi:hypothetical protein